LLSQTWFGRLELLLPPDSAARLWEAPGVADKLEESARIFFSSSELTVSLIPALIVGLLLLFLIPLAIPILLPKLGGSGGASYGSNLEVSDGYGAPDAGYGAPDAGYGAPEPSYDAPEPSYDAPAPSYDAPAPSYDAPAPSYDAPAPTYDAPSSSYSAGRLYRRSPVELPAAARQLYSEVTAADPALAPDTLNLNPALLQQPSAPLNLALN